MSLNAKNITKISMSINDMDMHEYAGGQGLLVKTMENNHHSKDNMTP